jgi:hypothetical protein
VIKAAGEIDLATAPPAVGEHLPVRVRARVFELAGLDRALSLHADLAAAQRHA